MTRFSIIFNNTNKLIKTLLFAFSLALPGLAVADSAMITSLNGAVTLNNGLAVAFSKVRQNDVIALGRGAQVEVVYLTSGIQENWGENSRFQIGAEQSQALAGAPLRVSKISPLLARQLSGTPDNLSSNSRVGMVRLRSTNIIKLREIENNYNKFKQEQAPGSFNAEVYKLNALGQISEFDLMEDFIGQLRRENPQDPTVSELAARYLQAIADSKSAMRNAVPRGQAPR